MRVLPQSMSLPQYLRYRADQARQIAAKRVVIKDQQRRINELTEDRDYWREKALGSQPLDVHEVVAHLVEAYDDGRPLDGISAADFVCAYNRLASEQMHELKQRARKAERRLEENEQASDVEADDSYDSDFGLGR